MFLKSLGFEVVGKDVPRYHWNSTIRTPSTRSMSKVPSTASTKAVPAKRALVASLPKALA